MPIICDPRRAGKTNAFINVAEGAVEVFQDGEWKPRTPETNLRDCQAFRVRKTMTLEKAKLALYEKRF